MPGCKTCRHLMPNGRSCKSPAVRGSAYCYFHNPQKSPRHASKPTESEFTVDIISEPSDIAAAGNRIMQALAGNRISNSRAAIMLQALQTVMASFRFALPEELNPNLYAPPTVDHPGRQ